MKFIFLLIICSMISGCSGGITNHIWNNIAEIVDFVVCGGNDIMQVSLMCGRREIDYCINGESTTLVPYGIITVNTGKDNFVVDNVEYILYVGVDKYKGKLENNPYDNSLVADIKSIVNKDDNISIDLFIDSEKYSFKLTNIDHDWQINSKTIIEKVLVKKYKDILRTFIKDGEFLGEIYIKLINDYDNFASRYYYYVSIKGRDNSNFSILISPKTSEILASNSFLK